MDGATTPIDPDGLMEFSVVFTDRSLNHMSKAFQGVMTDISAMLKEPYDSSPFSFFPFFFPFFLSSFSLPFLFSSPSFFLLPFFFSSLFLPFSLFFPLPSYFIPPSPFLIFPPILPTIFLNIFKFFYKNIQNYI